MWRCYRCESFNNSAFCFICGLSKNAPVPAAKPVNPVKHESTKIKPNAATTTPLFRGLDDGDFPASEKKGSVVPYVFLAIVLIILVVVFFYMNFY